VTGGRIVTASLILLLLAAGSLAFANGANDNFKGVATLFGAGAADYRRSLIWATATTLCGSLTAVLLAGRLLKAFSGRGLVAEALTADPHYLTAVALGAGATVLLATRVGLPISTTHALVGALVGAGAAAGSDVDLNRLGAAFFAPLLLSPVLAITATLCAYPLLRFARSRSGIAEETCVCLDTQSTAASPAGCGAAALQRVDSFNVTVDDAAVCRERFGENVPGVQAGSLLNGLHFLSAGAVGFARGLNDTPKIAALLLLGAAGANWQPLVLVGVLMAIGGIVSARRVAETMSHRITPMTHGQGLTANLATSAIVLAASGYGLPVSTTHVSCGALFGLGALTGEARWKTISQIVAAWIVTLPLAALCGAGCLAAVRMF
jgi:inorganic phosphate transporter, PiT family